METHDHGCARHWQARGPFALNGTTQRHARSRVLDVTHIRLEIAVDLEERTISGSVEHTAEVLPDQLEAFSLDAVGLTIEDVTIDGKTTAFAHDGENVLIRLASTLTRGTKTKIGIRYRGSPQRGLYFVGPDEAYPSKPKQAWTQGQDEDARYWFPCYDYPNQKSTSELRVTVARGLDAVSNGKLLERAEGPSTITFHWLQEVPHVTYLVSLVVGRFDVVEDASGPVPLRYLVPEGRRGDAVRTFGRTAAMMRRFAELVGHPYPFVKYDQTVVSDFIFGGMENSSATTLFEYTMLDASVEGIIDRDDLVAHELAHQWFGDLVTCRDWSEAWLNEGFATYFECLWYEHGDSPERGRYHLLEAARRYFQEDTQDYRRPIVCRTYDAPTDLFDRHLYEKGACVLHHLRLELGNDVFFRALRRYVASHARGHAQTVDLRRAIEQETGRNLDAFFDQWVQKGGHPDLEITSEYEPASRRLTLRVKQRQKVDAETPLFEFDLPCRVWHAGGRGKFVDRTFRVTGAEHKFDWELPGDPRGVRVNHGGGPLVRTDFDRTDGWLTTQLNEDDDLVGRIEAADALARSASTTAVTALTRALAKESLWMVRCEIARALGVIGSPAARDALIAALTQRDARVRSAVAHALGIRHDADAAQALRRQLQSEKTTWVRAAAYRALGRTRAAFAREFLAQGLDERGTWNDIVPRAALDGMVALRDPALESVFRAEARHGVHELRRTAAIAGLGELGARTQTRGALRETLTDLLNDKSFRAVVSAIQALRTLGDPDAAGALDALAHRKHVDGRIRRQARIVASALRADSGPKEAIKSLNDRVDKLDEERRKLLARIEKLEGRSGSPVRSGAASKRSKAGPKRRTGGDRRRGKKRR